VGAGRRRRPRRAQGVRPQQVSRRRVPAAARRALDKIKHHANFGRGGRFEKVFKQELSGFFNVDKLCVFVSADKIQVWGDGCHYDERFCLLGGLGWESGWNAGTWQDKISAEIDRNDTADYQERRIQENHSDIQVSLTEWNKEAVALMKQLEKVRERSHRIIQNLPVPTAATLRKDNPCWSNPSTALTEQFPNLFK
jgi:hypothetical protein